MGSLIAPLELTLSDIEMLKSSTFRYSVVGERYDVNIFLSNIGH